MNPKSFNSKKSNFNEKTEVWEEISVHNLEKVQYISELLEIRGNDKILDVGTGTGIMLPFYEKYLVDACVIGVLAVLLSAKTRRK